MPTLVNPAIESPSEAAAVGMCAERLERACAFVERAVVTGALPLATVLIARRGRIVAHRSYINPSLAERGYALQPDSLYYLASFTKMLVATLVMQQVEQGEIGLGQAVKDYLPEFGQRGKRAVTVRQLLAHASGLPEELNLPIETMLPVAELVALICEQPLVFAPGSRSSYCTWGYVLLAEILQRLTGRSLEALGREALFQPLGMANSCFGTAGVESRVIPIFTPALDLHHTFNRPDVLALVRGDTGAYSTAADLFRFCQMTLDGGRAGGCCLLSPVSMQRMLERQFAWCDTPERLADGSPEQLTTLSKGLGWQVRGEALFRGSDLMSARAYFHGGHMGMRAVVDPEYDLISIFLSSVVATEGYVPAHLGRPGQIIHRFGTMASAAIVEL